jgi:hypothetical protein
VAAAIAPEDFNICDIAAQCKVHRLQRKEQSVSLRSVFGETPNTARGTHALPNSHRG